MKIVSKIENFQKVYLLETKNYIQILNHSIILSSIRQ